MMSEVDFIRGRSRSRGTVSIGYAGWQKRGELLATSGRCKRKQTEA